MSVLPLPRVVVSFLTLSLLVLGILGADDHHFAVSFDDLALVAHGLYGSSYFHDILLEKLFSVSQDLLR